MPPAPSSRQVNALPAGPTLDDLLTDPTRLAAVRRLVVALGDRRGLDRLTRLAAMLIEAPYAQVSLIGTRQVVASVFGVDMDEDQRVGPAEDSLCTLTVLAGRPTPIGDARRDPRVSTLPTVASGRLRAYLGVPLVDSSGRTVGSLCAYDGRTRSWSPVQVSILTELAESVLAELELRALSVEASSTAARLGLALEAADIGSFDLDPADGTLVWDERLIRLFGYDVETFLPHLQSFNDRVHPEDLDRISEAITHATGGGGELAAEYRIVLPSGQVRWVEARGRMLRAAGRDRLLGVAYDSTQLRDARDRLARVLESMTDAFFSLGPDWRFSYVNRQAERLLDRRRGELLGRSIWEAFPQALGSPFEEHYRAAVEKDEPVSFEAPFDPLGGWYDVSAWPGPDGLSVYFREITTRRREHDERERAYAEREQAVMERERAYATADAASTRLAVLADAAVRLAESLEPQQVLERLGELVVPSLAQWVAVGLVAETASLLLGDAAAADLERVQVVHVAHEQAAVAARLRRLLYGMRFGTADPIGIGAVARTARSEWLPEMPRDAVAAMAQDEQQCAEMLQVLPGGLLTLPLTNRGRVLGALAVAEPVGGPLDRTLLAELANRAAVALDNALLYRAERRTGLTLQRSLLPQEVPAVPGMSTAARYLPGATGAFVGGDWYQGVRVGDGLVLAMGDVMGHGMRSAARMGQLRAIVATLALEGHGPAQLLTRLARSVDVLLDLELATLLVAAYDPEGRTLTVASAGHPPPLLGPLHGAPRFLDVEPGPPLGSFAFDYAETTFALAEGDTLVLYTDGLVENRHESLDVGLERLRQALVDVRLPPDAVCEHVLTELGRRGGADDDVALLVISHLPKGST